MYYNVSIQRMEREQKHEKNTIQKTETKFEYDVDPYVGINLLLFLFFVFLNVSRVSYFWEADREYSMSENKFFF